MKQALAILCVFFAVASTVMWGDDAVERIAEGLSMTRVEVETCMNKTNVRVEDLAQLDQLLDDNMDLMYVDRIRDIGCLLACLAQKKEVMNGARVNVDKIKKLTDPISTRQRIIRDEVLNICSDQVEGKEDECEISLKFLLCVYTETRRIMS